MFGACLNKQSQMKFAVKLIVLGLIEIAHNQTGTRLLFKCKPATRTLDFIP